MKRVLLAGGVLILALSAGGYLFRSEVKQWVRKYPALHRIASKAKATLGKTLPGTNPLGDLDANEQMRSADIRVDAAASKGRYTRFWGGLGQDSFNEGVLAAHNAAWFDLIGEMNRQRPVLTHWHSKGMLCDANVPRRQDRCGHVFQGQAADGSLKLNWDITDRVLDFVQTQGLQPLISLTYMPDSLASDPNRRNSWFRAAVSPPRDYDIWRDLVRGSVAHISDRYGRDTVSNWYFEVWNEPDYAQFFWRPHPDQTNYPKKGDNKEWFKLYDYSSEGAVAANPDIRLGGPAIAGDITLFLSDWLPHLEAREKAGSPSKVDFYSRHAYGDIEKSVLPAIKRFVDKGLEYGGERFRNAEFLLTETGPSPLPRDWLNSRYVAAWIVKEIDGFFFLGDRFGPEYVPDMMYFWTKPIPPNFDKHFGLVTALGSKWNPSPEAVIKRPALNGFDMLSRLGNERVKLEGTQFGDPMHGIATRDDSGRVQVLLYHLDESDKYATAGGSFEIRLTVDGLPAAANVVDEFRIDGKHSNAYTLWQEMGRPKDADPAAVATLQARDDLELVSSGPVKRDAQSSYRTTLTLQQNSVVLLTFRQE